MKVTKQMIEKGYIEIDRYDLESWKAVNDYNEQTKECVKRMQLIEGIKRSFVVLNIVLIAAMLLLNTYGLLVNPIKIAILLIVVGLLIYTIIKKSYFVYSICSAVLIFVDVRFIILIVANILLMILLRYYEKAVVKLPGYPHFNEIKIVLVEPKKKEQ